MLEHPEWSTDSRFRTNKDRVKNRVIVVELLNKRFSTNSIEKWLNALSTAGIPAAPINQLDQVFADPQVIARQMKITLMDNQGNALPQVGSPLRIPTAPPQYRSPPPKLGDSTEEVLHQLANLNSSEIQQLRDQRII